MSLLSVIIYVLIVEVTTIKKNSTGSPLKLIREPIFEVHDFVIDPISISKHTVDNHPSTLLVRTFFFFFLEFFLESFLHTSALSSDLGSYILYEVVNYKSVSFYSNVSSISSSSINLYSRIVSDYISNILLIF